VASRSPGLQESVRDGETGFLVPHADVPALGEALVRLLREDSLWWEMGRAAQTWAAEFHWERSASETLALAEEVIGAWRTQKH
jgi:glycosyltransferase involved in cell wall biosynthesis